MAKRTPSYFLVLLVFVVAAAITYWVRCKPVTVLFAADLQSFPMQVGSWRGIERPLDPAIVEALGADSTLSRSYEGEDGEGPIGLLVQYRKYGRREFVHRPEMCYPAAGWEIVEKGYTDIPYGGRSVRAVKIVAELGYEREVILYWFASGGRTEASFVRQQFTMALDRLRTQKYGWAFIRLNSPVLDFYSDEETVEHIRDFLRDASGSLVDVLTSPEVAQTGWLPDG